MKRFGSAPQTAPRSPRAGHRAWRLVLAGLLAVGVSTLLAAAPASADPPPSTGIVTLGGRVWNDLNADGIQDAGEPGLAGVTVIVDWGLGPAYRVTDADGRYVVDNVEADRPTTVFFTAPDGDVFSPQAARGSTPSTDSDPNDSGTVPPVSYPAGTVRLDIDAGVHPVQAPTTTTIAPTTTQPAPPPSVLVSVPTVPATVATTEAPASTTTAAVTQPAGSATTAPATVVTPTTGAPVVAGIAVTAPPTTEVAASVLATSTARSSELARTGSDAWRTALPVALALLGLGCLLLGTSRRLTRAR